MKNPDDHLPLHVTHVQKSSLIINRSHTLLHCIALTALIYYRAISLLHISKTRHNNNNTTIPILPLLLVFASELVLIFSWLLSRAPRWRPVSRAVFPERLPEDEELPGIDVFICTADARKEPTLDVMNTVLSAMALDYPAHKLCLYLSDDGGSNVTLLAMKETWEFAKCWLPFCRTFGIKTRCPKAYFSDDDQDDCGDLRGSMFLTKKDKVKEKYKMFTEQLVRIAESAELAINRDHPPVIEVIYDTSNGKDSVNQAEMPVLVYVSREKRPSHPHHFKAGALNVLLRVSSLISNSTYILVLDCDMYCNEPTSAKQAMCFHLDPNISHSLAFVQFPQKFGNISKNDIYDSQLRSAFMVLWHGIDGLSGPILSGTNFYMKRDALFGYPMQQGIDQKRINHSFAAGNGGNLSPSFLQEAKQLASCAYEKGTEWGKKVGFLYFSVVEDYFTGLNMHCRGWKSVYCDPKRLAFLGMATTNLDDVLVQGSRWSCGLANVWVSRYCPLTFGLFKMSSFLQAISYADLAFNPFCCFPLSILATLPQLCLLNGLPLYPHQVSNPFSIVLVYIFVSSQLKHLQEVLSSGGSFQTWVNEQRIWMMKGVTCHLYGSLQAIMKMMGLGKASFLATNKVVDDEREGQYQNGKFDFQTSTLFLAPLVTLFILNVTSLIVGILRMITMGSFNNMMSMQLFLAFYVASLNYPIFEGMFLRKDKGGVPLSVTILCSLFCTIFMSLGSIILMY